MYKKYSVSVFCKFSDIVWIYELHGEHGEVTQHMEWFSGSFLDVLFFRWIEVGLILGSFFLNIGFYILKSLGLPVARIIQKFSSPSSL